MKASDFTAADKNFYIIKGNDLYLKDEVVAKITELLPQSARIFNYRRFDGEPLGEIVEFLMTPPQFADKRLALAEEFPRPFTAAEADAFLDFIETAPKNRIFAVIDNADKFAFASKYATVVDCSRLSPEKLFDRVFAMGESRGVRLSPSAINALIEYCAADLARISTELKKLGDYKEWNVSAELIEELVASDAEISVFKFSGAVAKRENDNALELLSRLLKKGNSPVALLALLQSQYRRMFLFSLAEESDEELASLYGVKPAAVSINRREAKNYTPMQLKTIVELLSDYEYKLKSGALRPEAALLEAVGKILVLGRRTR